MSKGAVVVLVVVACLILLIANVSLWAAFNVFNADRFGSHVAEGLQSPVAAEALAEPIVDHVMTEHPDLPPLARGPAEEVVAWMLQRPAFATVSEKAAAAALTVMTSSAEDVVGIDLADKATELSAALTGVISGIAPEVGADAQEAVESAIQTSQESGRLAIYEQGRTPKLRAVSNIAPWLALLAGLGAIAVFVAACTRAADQHKARLYTGAGVMITSVLGFMLTAPIVNGYVQNGVASPNMQVVVGEIVSVFLRSYAVQSLILFIVGLAVVLINHYHAAPDQTTTEPETA